MSLGRSTISPTPTMTGMRSSGSGVSDIFSCFAFDLRKIRRVGKGAKRRAHHPTSCSEMVGTLRFAHPTRGSSLLHQRIHMLHRIGKILLEFLHHRAGGLDTVDQADALADEIRHEIARLRIP